MSIYPEEYSRSGVVRSAISKVSRFDVEYFPIKNTKYAELKKYRSRLKKLKKEKGILIIMSPSHIVTIFSRPFFRGPIILDAGWPLSDSSEIRKGKRSIEYLKTQVLDRLSMRLADLVLVETKSQKEWLLKQKF